MRNLIVTLLFISSIQHANAQFPKLIVQLKDKGSNRFSLNAPSQYLSPRAIQRRSRYNIPIDSADLPITTTYLDSIKIAGAVTVLSTSKWLNQVLIETSDQNALNKIKSYPFVISTRGVGFRSADTTRNDKFKDPLTSALPPVSRLAGTATDTYDYGNSYGQVHIHEGEFLHNRGFHGETMQIAVLDAGFLQYKTITAFDSIRNNGQILGERDYVAFDSSVNEDDSHGMYCLSILSANWPGKMVGTAPKANYWLVRTENAATEYVIEEHNWVAGAEFADSTGSDLISTSLGYTTFDDPALNHSYNDLYKNTTMVSQGAAIAVKKGMIVSASAGNEGANSWKYISFPADVDSVCTVGAVNAAGVIAGFSSYGYPGKVKPNIVSVGANTVIAGLNNQPVTGNGTSFSNPNVAGLIACLWQAFPNASNMKILNAVYKSSDRYTAPDSHYGYGIPNFRLAYQSLKHGENIAVYGNDWLFATPNLFTDQLAVRVIGRLDGPVAISLLNAAGQVVATQNLATEKEEVYNHTFSNLGSLPSGIYSVKYSDGITTRTIQVTKGNIFEKEWFVALSNPFTRDFTVFIKGQETGEIVLRLIDTKGSVVEVINTQIAQNETLTLHFNNAQKLAPGVYFIQYLGKSQKRTVRLFKGSL
jgi:subtilisin family serine protease